MLRIFKSTAAVVVALMVAVTAAAGELETRAEAVMVDAIKLVETGSFTAWIDKFCDPERCHTPLSKANWEAYQLKSAKTNAPYCLYGPDKNQVKVARWRGVLGTDRTVRAYLECTNRQLPVPVELRLDPETNKIWIRNVSF